MTRRVTPSVFSQAISHANECGAMRFHQVGQKRLTIGGRITVWLVSSLTRLDLTKNENMLLFVCCEAIESKLVKLETSHTVILFPKLSFLCEVTCVVILLGQAIHRSLYLFLMGLLNALQIVENVQINGGTRTVAVFV